MKAIGELKRADEDKAAGKLHEMLDAGQLDRELTEQLQCLADEYIAQRRAPRSDETTAEQLTKNYRADIARIVKAFGTGDSE